MATTPVPQPLSQPQQGPMQESLGMPTTPTYADLIKSLSGPRDVTGMTQVSPAGSPLPPASQQTSPPQREQVQQFGPGGRGAAMRQDAANMAIAAHNMAQNIGQKVEARKQRQYQQVTDQYTGYVKGISESQSQIQQGTQLVQQAQQRLQADPNDAQAKQIAQQGQQMVQQGQAALQQNQTNMDDLANDPKKHKVILKAFGIDDKNANTPERQAAIASVRKQMGVSQQSANLISRMPARQQLSPEGAAQAEAVKSGIVGRPATQGQQLSAATTLAKTQMQEQGKDARAATRQQVQMAMNGLKTDDSGKVVPMTPEEIAKNPVLSSKMAVSQAKQELDNAQAALAQAKTRAVPEQMKLAEARVNIAQANLGMRQKEFGLKIEEEERKQLETKYKIGTATDIEGITMGRPLQSWAQQTIANSKPVLDQIDGLMKQLEPLKDNNQPGYLAMDRLGYAMGMGSPDGELASSISNLELQRVIGAARILKGSSRAYQALQWAAIHTPNAWKDSPQLMYQKLQTIKSNLEGTIQDSITYGGKGQTQGQAAAALSGGKKAAKPGPSAAPTDEQILNEIDKLPK